MFDWFSRRKTQSPSEPAKAAPVASPVAAPVAATGPDAKPHATRFGLPADLSAAPAQPHRNSPHAAAPTAAAQSQAGSNITSNSSATSNGYAQRWPLLGADGAVRGFELARGGAAQRQDASGAASVAHQVALMAAARLAQSEGRQALVSLPAAALGRAAVMQQVERGMWLAATDAWADSAVQQSLRARGARLGATMDLQRLAASQSGSASPALPEGLQNLDFVLLRATSVGLDTVLAVGERLRRQRPKLPLLATGVAAVGEIEQLLRAGFSLVGGRLGGRSVAAAAPSASAANAAARPAAAGGKTPAPRSTARSLEPSSVRLFALINHLAQDCDNVVIADAARKDVALSYRLLRYANSPAVGLRHSVDSIEQALSLLGRNEFRRWLQVMLLTTGSTRPASLALQEDALARARLFESLGRECGEAATDALFTLGLLSQLDLLLQVPLAEALEPLRLPEDTRAALLGRRGAWASYLALADELEQDDESRLEQAATAFGGAAAVLAQAQSAWGWAARVMASQQTATAAPEKAQAVPT